MKRNQVLGLAAALIIIVATWFFVAQPGLLSVASRVNALHTSKGTKHLGLSTTEIDWDTANLTLGNYYDFCYDIYWEEDGNYLDVEHEDLRVEIIREHMIEVQEMVWADFLADSELTEYMYPQYIETEIVSCSDYIDDGLGTGHYEIEAEVTVQAVCIKNPIAALTIGTILQIIIIAGFVIIVGFVAVEILRHIAVLIHGWPPTPPVAPPEGASEELWLLYYGLYDDYIHQRDMWYVVLLVIALTIAGTVAFVLYNKYRNKYRKKKK